MFIIVLSGVFAATWTKLGHRQPAKTAEVRSGHHDHGPGLPAVPVVRGGHNSIPLLALIGIVLVYTLAELLLSPVGLSVTTKLAPEAFHTQMVALIYPLGVTGAR